MRGYKRVLAWLLAANLAVTAMPAGVISVKADTKEATESAAQTATPESTAVQEDKGAGKAQAEASVEPSSTPKSTDKKPTPKAARNVKAAGDSVEKTLNVEEIVGADGTSTYDSANRTINVNSQMVMILLSNCKPSQVKDLKIIMGNTGDTDLTKTVEWNGGTYTFQGIASAEEPFEGSISGSAGITKLSSTLFGGLSSKAVISEGDGKDWEITWCAKETDDPMIADAYRFDDKNAEGHTLPFHFTCDTGAVAGRLLGTVTAGTNGADQKLIIGDVVAYNQKSGNVEATKVTATTQSGNVGLICDTLEAGTICLDGYQFPTGTITLNAAGTYKDNDASAAGNAGGVIGVMEKGTSFQIKSAQEGKIALANLSVSGTGNAGGLVGLMGKGASISAAEGVQVTLTSPKIEGERAVGGVAGEAENMTMTGDTKAWTIAFPTVKGNTEKSNAGGFIGHFVLSNSEEQEQEYQIPDCLELTAPTVSTNKRSENYGNSGGYFGYLEISGRRDIRFAGDSSQKFEPVHAACAKMSESYGGLIGKVCSSTIENTVSIQGMSVRSTYNHYAKYHGGLVGEVGNAGKEDGKTYIEISDVSVTVFNPYAGVNRGMGGLVGILAQGDILKTSGTVQIATDSTGTDKCIWEGGGLVGNAEPKSVIELSGTTDLSGVNFITAINPVANTGIGNLVGFHEGALVYSRGDGNSVESGWKYIRGVEWESQGQYTSKSGRINDLADYGQVIRLKSEKSELGLSEDLIKITDDHKIVLNDGRSLEWGGDIAIHSADEFALLAIAWNSRGYWSASTDITHDNWQTICEKNISLTTDINLVGSGVLGLSQDNSEEIAFSGVFDGDGHTLTLGIGEAYGYVVEETNYDSSTKTLTITKTKPDEKDEIGGGVLCARVSDNGGKIIWHNRQGLFAKTQNATVKNVTIAGEINVRNTFKEIVAGGIAGECNNTTVQNVTAAESVYANCHKADVKTVVGGMFGKESGSKLSVQDSSEVSSKITLAGGTEGAYTYAGGVIGLISSVNYTLDIQDLTVKNASLSSSATKYAYIGGVAGMIKPVEKNKPENMTKRTVNIGHLVFEGASVQASDATKVCGGLLGSMWSNTEVNIKPDSNTADAENTWALSVSNAASVQASKAANGVGGLVYRASGIWNVAKNGINLQGMSIAAKKDVGLLVCHGEQGEEVIERLDSAENPEDYQFGALYLQMTANWKDAYKLASDEQISITQTDSSAVFDELVAHTADSAEDITENGQNGIISLATEESAGSRAGVGTASSCTTYQNRTKYGSTKKTNGCSRYYYDLDQYVKNTETDQKDGWIDTPQELLLWSVYHYASPNLQNYFVGTSTDVKGNRIGSASSEVGLDMKKYSYYPVTVDQSVTTVQKAIVTFHNEEIESLETTAANKSTSGASSKQTQHYLMHFGLFWNQEGDTDVTVQSVKFRGTIGRIASDGTDSNAEGSGALFAGNVAGRQDGSVQRTASLTMKDITLEGIRVYNCRTEYAPLLINRVGSYTTLDIQGIGYESVEESIKYTMGTAAASSLFGAVGDTGAEQITLSFLDIVLPDQWKQGSEGIFTHATLLESFTYNGTSVGTYNFYSKDDWDGTEHNKNVTYGQEITGTTEYPEQQKWYYDEENYGKDTNFVHDEVGSDGTFTLINASKYLPYVYQSYNSAEKKHELKINQRVADITTGCGTYAHPYEIKSDREMKILSEYMTSNGSSIRQDWRVTITSDQSAYCDKTGTDEVTYQYRGNEWKQVERTGDENGDTWTEVKNKQSLSNDTMFQYLLNAYYDLQGTAVSDASADNDSTDDTSDADTSVAYELSVTDFDGFGSYTNPFRGVITSSKKNMTLVLSGAGGGNGLITYSNGSVVKNLSIDYKVQNGTGKTLTYNESTVTEFYPGTFFGGVIGCVMGGDNIIDGVTVAMDDGFLTLAGSKPQLIQAGGYVGSVCGGGVIFRNMTGSTGLTDSKVTNVTGITGEESAMLYVNPYVGRVLDGFAFYEAPYVTYQLRNTNKNYTISTIIPHETACIGNTDQGIRVNDAQGLLILSAMVNSGAASDGANNAYSKTANSGNATVNGASYTFGGAYGKVRNSAYAGIGDAAQNEAVKKAAEDDQKTPGSANLPYLLTVYGSKNVFSLAGDAGASIQLAENEAYDMTSYKNGYQGIGARYVSNAIRKGTEMNPKGIVPELKTLDGNQSTVIVDMQVKEYAEDDFRVASVGGMVNLLRAGSAGTAVSDLTVSGKEQISTESTGKSYTGVSLRYYDANGQVMQTKYVSQGTASETELNTRILKFYVGDTERAVEDWENRELVETGAFGGTTTGISASSKMTGSVKFSGVKIENIVVDGPIHAGGLLGSAENRTARKADTEANPDTDIAGLLKGKANFAPSIAIENTTYHDVEVNAASAAGGYVGKISNDSASVSCSVSANADSVLGKDSIIGKDTTNTSYAGGLFGDAKAVLAVGDGTSDAFYKLENLTVSARTYAGGAIGHLDTINGDNKTKIGQLKLTGLNVQVPKGTGTNNKINIEEKAGGVLGYLTGTGKSCTITDCVVMSSQINTQEHAPTDNAKNEFNRAGGIVGDVTGTPVEIRNCKVSGSLLYGGYTGGIAGCLQKKSVLANCVVTGTDSEKKEIAGRHIGGGFIGCFATGESVTIQNSVIKNLSVKGNEWGGGAFIGDSYNGNTGMLYLFDDKAENVEAYGADAVGGIIGDLRGKVRATNILLSELSLSAKSVKTAGILFGNADRNTPEVYMAGLSIQRPDATLDSMNLYGLDKANAAHYIAFADYSGTAANHTGTAEDELIDTPAQNSPYVVTSPKNENLKLYESKDADAQYLYGDGAFWSTKNGTDADSFGMMAQQIWKGRKQNTDGHYAYSSMGSTVDDDFDLAGLVSTYNQNQSATVDEDFPVLQITGGDAGKVISYLDIVTNGGFSAANEINANGDVHVSATSVAYKNIDGKFIKSSGDAAFRVTTNSDRKISFSTTTDYDNGNDRFTLLKVTFTEKEEDGKTEHSYHVYVPIIVRRMLEMDFTATLTYGTDYRAKDYLGLTNHVLEGFGSPITGYLTYTYNSAKGEYVDYGWQSYINAGGDLTDMKKSIRFASGTRLPKGTQLTIVDSVSKRAYYYSVTGTESHQNNALDIPLSAFADSENHAYQEPSISEVLDVKAGTSGSNKLFVKVDKDGKPEGAADAADKTYNKPTIRIKQGDDYEYYRLASSEETATHTISLDEATQKVTENYYLVITVPENSETNLFNGSIQTDVSSKIPHQVHYRTITGGEDTHNNTASTYLLSTGYSQTLTETNITAASKLITTSDTKMKVDVTDHVTFPNGQRYNSSDQLYLKLTGGLQKTVNKVSSAEQFPSGTSGKVTFYVYIKEDGKTTYYRYEDGDWVDAGSSEKRAASYTWTSTGGNMELPLSTDGSEDADKLIGLQTIREKAKNGHDTGTGAFYVEARMELELPPTSTALEVIPESAVTDQMPDDYTKLTYTSQISVVPQSLSYSSNRAVVQDTTTAYYREEPAGAKLTYDADNIDQLGINLLDLRYLDASQEASNIDTTAVYDLSSMKNLENTLKNSKGIRFRLSLQQKKTDEGKTEDYREVTDPEKYLDVILKSENSGEVKQSDGNWTWTVPKTSYYDTDTGKVKTGTLFDGSVLTQNILLKVHVADVEKLNHIYANYNVVLQAEILDQSGDVLNKTEDSDNLIYTLTRIKLDFIQ